MAVDYDALGLLLQALGAPTRLRLLHELRVPKRSAEVLVPPSRQGNAGRPTRPVARQTVEEHLARLREIGLVVAESSSGATLYRVDHGRLFAVVDELGRISQIPVAPTHAETVHDDHPTVPRVPDRPGLMALNSPQAGSFWALEGAGPFTIGRAPGQWMALAHDPFVSQQHAVLSRGVSGPVVAQHPDASNPCYLNGTPVPGEGVPVRAGDILQVGRTLLVVHRV